MIAAARRREVWLLGSRQAGEDPEVWGKAVSAMA